MDSIFYFTYYERIDPFIFIEVMAWEIVVTYSKYVVKKYISPLIEVDTPPPKI